MLRPKLILVFIIFAAAVSAGIWYWQRSWAMEELISFIPLGSAVNSNVLFSPSFPTSFSEWEGAGITVVSTGRVSDYEIRDRVTGAVIGNSQILETLSSNDRGNATRIDFVIQIVSVSNPDRVINPWTTRHAAGFGSKSLPEGEGPVFTDVIEEIFPRGSRWIFIPLTDLEAEVLDSIPEYQYYARSYYGSDLEKVRSYVENDFVGGWSKPIFLLDIFSSIPN